jgi:hypothetical protein
MPLKFRNTPHRCPSGSYTVEDNLPALEDRPRHGLPALIGAGTFVVRELPSRQHAGAGNARRRCCISDERCLSYI